MENEKLNVPVTGETPKQEPKDAPESEGASAGIDFSNSEFKLPDEIKAETEESKVETVDQTKLLSASINEDLMKDRVTGLSIEERSGYERGSYMIDISQTEMGATYEAQAALRLLLSPDGTVPIYLHTKTHTFMVGKADSYQVYLLLDKLIKPLFGEDVVLLYNRDGEFRKVQSVGLTTFRLNL